jgi:peptidyl-prolyl cis-trans isomerase SurA
MTNQSFKYPASTSQGVMASGRSRLLAALVLALPAVSLQAQALRPSVQLRMPSASTPSGAPSLPGPGSASASGSRQADFIVAVVNSEPITNNDVRSKMVRAEQQLTQQGAALPPRNELARQVLERMINDKAQLQLARTSGLRVDENAIDNAVLTVAQQNQLSVEELRRRLIADGIPYSQFRSDIRDELLVVRLRQREVDARVSVTEGEIDQFLRDQQGSSDVSALELNLAQILIAVPENASPEQVAALQSRANLAAERARSGADFGALSNEFSDSPAKASGGQMGLRSAERYPPLFLEATQNLKVGGIAGPLRSGAGFHILKVLERKQGGMPGINVTQTHARHILLRPGPELSEAAAKEKLADIRKRVLAGQADFAAEARQNSADGSAKEGGDLGWTNPGSFVPEFEQPMNALAPGQISEPLTSRFGVHLVQVLERRDTQLSTRDQRELARNVLREKKLQQAYSVWAQEVRGRAYVEYREAPQ